MTRFPTESLDAFTRSDYQIIARRFHLRAILAVSDWYWGPRLLALRSVTAPVIKTIPEHAMVKVTSATMDTCFTLWISSWIFDTWFTLGSLLLRS